MNLRIRELAALITAGPSDGAKVREIMSLTPISTSSRRLTSMGAVTLYNGSIRGRGNAEHMAVYSATQPRDGSPGRFPEASDGQSGAPKLDRSRSNLQVRRRPKTVIESRLLIGRLRGRNLRVLPVTAG
jgi:hypothetical protein